LLQNAFEGFNRIDDNRSINNMVRNTFVPRQCFFLMFELVNRPYWFQIDKFMLVSGTILVFY
jgi:hypothetical protein